MSVNRLGDETSPYLLQHRDNPVHWRAWGEAALAEARALDKPILLSIGYAACHWCHVMARESFENPEIASVMNDLFIPIKVDREERPDIDAIYMQALHILGEQGGWPLTMFLTPAAQPFWGGTYFPPTPRWGRPGFPQVLHGVSAVYHGQKDKVARNVATLTDGLRQMSRPAKGGSVDHALLDQIAARLLQAIDPIHGGIKGAPKFPNCGILALLWRGHDRGGPAAMRDAVLLTLDRMSQGGIYDHLGGGFARYSTDEMWLAPHFEKMLYDNAQLLELLCLAWQATGKDLYRQRVEETIGWLLREMRAPSGGFAATIDADSEHEEGKFYVWDASMVDALLGADAALFKAHYDVTTEGNWEGKTILNRTAKPDAADGATEAVLTRCRARLFTERALRVHPERDDKVLADWNGLMIAALAEAAAVFGRPDWLDAAIRAWDFITGPMMNIEDRLAHSWRQGRSHPGTLDDYANMARAGLRLFEATGDQPYLDQVERWMAVLDRHFADPEGGYFFTANDTETLIARTKSAGDSAVPAGNGTLVEVLGRLSFLTGTPAYAAKAESLIATFSGEVERNFYPLATYLNGIDFNMRAVQIFVIGQRSDPAAVALFDACYQAPLPNRVITLSAPDTAWPAGHPAAGKPALDGKPTAYICVGATCSLPHANADSLRAALSKTHKESLS
jgi:uncharacterized protein YyaL (SSP411 family)